MPKKAKNASAENCCSMCGRPGCHCYKWTAPVKGLILVVLGALLWMGTWTLEVVLGILLVLGGIKVWLMHKGH